MVARRGGVKLNEEGTRGGKAAWNEAMTGPLALQHGLYCPGCEEANSGACMRNSGIALIPKQDETNPRQTLLASA